MSSINQIFLSALGVLAGGLIAVQSVLNSSLGQRAGYFGSALLLTFISAIFLILLIVLFPNSANFRDLPGISEWCLYVGGVLGIVILAAPIYLIPMIGTTLTLMAIILGQSLIALLIDHFGLFASPRIELNFARGMGVLLVIIGASLWGDDLYRQVFMQTPNFLS